MKHGVLSVSPGAREKSLCHSNRAGVAAAGVGAAAGSYIGESYGRGLSNAMGDTMAKGVIRGASAIANAAARSLMNGGDFGDNIMAALPDVIGQTIGEAIAGGIANAQRNSPGAIARRAAADMGREEAYFQTEAGAAVLAGAQGELEASLRAARSGGLSEMERLNAGEAAYRAFLESTAVTDEGLGRLAAYDYWQRYRPGAIEETPLGPIGTAGSGYAVGEVWERSLVDPISVRVGSYVVPAMGQVANFLEEHPGVRWSLKAVEVGMAVAMPARFLAEQAIGAATGAAIEGNIQRFQVAGYSPEQAAYGGVGGPVAVMLAIGGVTGAMRLAERVGRFRIHVDPNAVGAFGGNLRVTRETAASPALVARIQGMLALYPEVLDLRTGRAIPFPSDLRGRVPVDARAPWGAAERGDFIAEWNRRGYEEPRGGWANYDVHHIKPREYGGGNDFWNLTPVERTTHQRLFNPFWEEFGR